jgi:NAD(P)-dependent dehydrogenase (short-subunit alcohol dehydrogenase family)
VRKVAFITGGTDGLGLSIIKKLLAMGYEVVSVCDQEERIKEANKFLKSETVLFFTGNITEEETLEKVYQYLLSEYGYVNVIINHEEVMIGGGLERTSSEEWEHVFETNVNLPFRIIKKFLGLIRHAEYGCIVNISSIASTMTGGGIAYSASKAALDMMTKSMAKELAKYYIRVNSVNPGVINNGIQPQRDIVKEWEYEKFLEKTARDYPLGTGTTEDVANLIGYLVSEKGRWITGSNYIIDGGRMVNN